MPGGMPVLGQDNVLEIFGEVIDEGNHIIASRHREVSTRTEIILNINNKENFVFCGIHAINSLVQGSGASLEGGETVDNDVNRDRAHYVGQLSLFFKHRAESAGFQLCDD